MASNIEVKNKVREELRSIQNFLNSPMYKQRFGDSKLVEDRLMFSWLEDLSLVIEIYQIEEERKIKECTDKDDKIKVLETRIKDMERFSYLMV